RGLAGIVPLEAGVAAAALVLAAQFGLGPLEIVFGVARAAFVAGAVGRGVVVVAELRIVVALVAIVLAPVGLFHRGVHALAHRLAGQATGDRANRRAHRGANRSGQRARSRSGDAAGRSARAGTDRMRTRRAGDRVAVGIRFVPRPVRMPVVVVVRHRDAPVGYG